MKILIIYATNSGGTQRVASLISEVLTQQGHAVTIHTAAEQQPEDLSQYDGILLGSCSWDYKGAEGQPHIDMRGFLERGRATTNASQLLAGKKIAVFGLGDTSYMYFTGAVNHLETFVADCGGSLLVPSLRIDGFYFDQEPNEALAIDWAKKLAEALAK